MADSAWRILSLCSGVGGLDLGIRIAAGNARTVGYVEIEAYAAAILAARIADGWLDAAPIWLGDLRELDPTPWCGVVDCIVGGYPCQPFSVAGKRRGHEDDRHLWPGIAAIVAAIRPRRCFFENVPGHLTLGFDQVGADLQGMGYRVAAGVFSAAEVGASHRRERLFVMADCQSSDGRLQLQPRGQKQARTKSPGCGEVLGHAQGIGWREGRPEQPRRVGEPASGQSGGDVADTSHAGLPISEQPRQPGSAQRWLGAGAAAPEFRGRPVAIFAPGPADPRWAAILRDEPRFEPAVCRAADGAAPGVDFGDRIDRLRACGNAVVPLVAAYAWQSLDALLRADAEIWPDQEVAVT